jgi:hypothetical protein
MIMVKVLIDESHPLLIESQGFEPGTIWWETEDYNS